jgi:hypothetical protein
VLQERQCLLGDSLKQLERRGQSERQELRELIELLMLEVKDGTLKLEDMTAERDEYKCLADSLMNVPAADGRSSTTSRPPTSARKRPSGS